MYLAVVVVACVQA